MPTYTFRNKETNDIHDKFLNISAKDSYLEANPNLETIITSAPPIGDSVRLGLRKPDSSFNEVLHKIASNNYKSNLKEKLSRN